SSDELPGLGKIASLTVVREQKARKHGAGTTGPWRPAGDGGAPATTTPPSGLAWGTDQGVLALGAGAEPLVTLKMGARPERKLADDPALERFIRAVGGDASTIVIAQPLRLDPKRANLPTAPLGIAIGRKSGDA